MDRQASYKALLQQPRVRFVGALCLAWALLNLPVLLGIRVTPWDAMDEFYPTAYFNAHTLRMGMLPWWNPYIYSGYPQAGDPQGMLFSPLLMGWMLLLRDPGVTWFNWAILLHLLMGGGAMTGLLQRSGGNRFGALVGAIVFMAGGVAAARLEHVPDVLAYAWSPAVLLALRHFLAKPGWRRALLLGLSAAALVTQLVQVTFLLVLMIVGYFVAGSAARWRWYSPGERRQWALGVAVAGAIALIGGLPQLMFSWAYVSLSNRAVLPLSAASVASLDPWALLSLFDPNAWHALRGTYDGAASRVEGYLYIGAIPMLMLAGLVKAWRDTAQRRQLLFFLGVALLACLYMFGTHTPFYGWLYGWMPGLKQFRRPSDAAYLLNFSLAVFAGLGASQFNLASRRLTTTVLALAVVWLSLASLHMRGEGVRWQSGTILAAMVALLALWRLRRNGAPARTYCWLILVLVADYRCFNLNGSFNQGHDNAQRLRKSDVTTYLASALKSDNWQLPYRIEPFGTGILWDNYVVLTGLQSTQGYNPLRYELYDQWYGAHENGNVPRVNRPFNPGVGSKLSDLLSVRYIVAGHGQDVQAALAAKGLIQVFAGRRSDVWLNREAYPRLLNPTQAHALSFGESPSPEDFSETDFARTVWLTPRDEQDQRADQELEQCNGTIRIHHVRARTSRLDLDAEAGAPGWLVLGELDFPGWRASVDGRPWPIHRANGIFRAICVPEGRHAVRFAFHPWSMVADAWRQR